MDVIYFLTIISFLLIAIFIYEVRKFRSRIELEETDPETQPDGPFVPYAEAFFEGLRQSVENGLKRIIAHVSASAFQAEALELKSLLEQHLNAITSAGFQTLRQTIEKEAVKTFMMLKSGTAIYVMALPFLGDRPTLLRQMDGFSMGLGHHIDEIFARLSAEKDASKLVLVAFFFKPGTKEGLLYAGYRDKGTCLLPRPLLNNVEIGQKFIMASDFRQTI